MEEVVTIEELRVGNMVSFTDFPVLNNPIVLNRSHLYNERFVESFCKPIPLTEEWLIKFGLKSNFKGHYFLEVGCMFIFVSFNRVGDIDSGIGIEYDEDFECSKHVEIKHVHQLQNLHFALTGVELEIK